MNIHKGARLVGESPMGECQMGEYLIGERLFKASALWAHAFYKSKCPYVCLCVCLSVCVFTFEVPFKRLFAPTS